MKPRRTMPSREFAIHREQLEALAILIHPLDFERFVETIRFVDGLPGEFKASIRPKLAPSIAAIEALDELAQAALEFRTKTRGPLLRLLAERSRAGDPEAPAVLAELATADESYSRARATEQANDLADTLACAGRRVRRSGGLPS